MDCYGKAICFNIYHSAEGVPKAVHEQLEATASNLASPSATLKARCQISMSANVSHLSLNTDANTWPHPPRTSGVLYMYCFKRAMQHLVDISALWAKIGKYNALGQDLLCQSVGCNRECVPPRQLT